ncbi:MAG: RloB domain-containing protein [Alphaproteobacteria bacterium]|nr:RloB domain-containing protein [Alphaproteobacteria bacterium]
MLIACEGHTERNYFEAVRLKLQLRNLEIASETGLDPGALVHYVERRVREEGPFEHIICAFDKDSHAHFRAARARIRELKSGRKPLAIQEAVTVPCIEFWFLLHFEQTTSPYQSSAEVIARIKAAGHIPDYEKADANICRTLVDRMNVAIANAAWLSERAAADGFDNPFTNFHEVLKLLRGLAA